MARVAVLRALASRFSFGILLTGAVALMLLGKFDAVVMDNVRARFTDAVAPILDGMSRPAATVADMVNEVRSLADLRAENAALRVENEALLEYRAIAHALLEENRQLSSLLNYVPAAPHTFITARVVGDNSGAFVRSLAINMGNENGIRDGLPAMGANGLVGRTVQTGDQSGRILLITDLNARIPVLLEDQRWRAVLGGDNTGQPELLHLVADAEVRVGDRVITSGHGGMFPPGLPVGRVASVSDGAVRVEPFEDLSRMEFVRIYDFVPYRDDAMLRAPSGYFVE